MKRFLRPLGRRGNVAFMAALAIVPIVAGVGLSVDAARGYLLRSRLIDAVDAAALAGGRVLTSDDVKVTRDIRMYFRANLPADTLGASIPDPTVTISPDRETIEVNVEAELPTTFMRVLGFQTMEVGASNRVRRTNRGLELALVLDETGSMATDDRIGKLRNAATDLVEILWTDTLPQDQELLWMSVVPYVAMVNLGGEGAVPRTRPDWTFEVSPALEDFAPSSWRGCIEARPFPYDLAEDPPTVIAPFRRLLSPSTLQVVVDDDGKDASDDHDQGQGNDGKKKGNNDWPPVSDTGAYTNHNDLTGPNLGCGHPVLPLTNDKRKVLDAIKRLRPVNRGGTMANLGLQAGWFTLSPAWRGWWKELAEHPGRPLNYKTRDNDKAVVLLTDGDNQWHKEDYTAYGHLAEGRLGTTKGNKATEEIDKRMSTMCTNMKSAGITIYTITIGLKGSKQSLYRKCATQPAYYFDSPTGSDLRQIFQRIGSELSNLRLES
jgi:Flp pilus assembly protein TadG